MGFDIDLNDEYDAHLDGNDLALTPTDEQTLQEIGIRLQLWRGEWFLDIQQGIPYLEQVFVKGTGSDTISALFQKEILEAEGVIELLEFEMDFDSTERTLRIDFKVHAEEGIISDIIEVSI